MSVFVDKVGVKVKAGRGGDGVVAWRREKFVDMGGPSGGDGGDGGSVIVVGDQNITSLQGFRHNQVIKAEDGKPGAKQNKHGKKGEDIVLPVPLGTQVFNDELMIADIAEQGQEAVVAKGGRGGFGNAHFKSSKRRSPQVAEKGEAMDTLKVDLELKLIADVGLIGLPNAGKSTLLSVVSNARPEIADYPFTTLTPNLGVVDFEDDSLLFADIPGLIEGASKGKGLGDEFLRHIERTAVLVHLVDVYGDDIAKDYQTIRKELQDYKIDLSEKPSITVLSRTDGLEAKELNIKKKLLEKISGQPVFVISSHTKDGLEELLPEIARIVKEDRLAPEVEEEEELETITLADEELWAVDRADGVWQVSGEKIEKFSRKTDQENEWGISRLKDIMRRIGVIHELARQGAKPGDKVMVGDIELEL